MILAGLQSMPENLHRAARINGDGAVRRFFRITLPWLRPMVLLVLILTSINSIMAFDLFWTMTHGEPSAAMFFLDRLCLRLPSSASAGRGDPYLLTVVCLILAGSI